MASQEWDESEYPYAARYGNTPAPFPTEVTLHLEHARFIWRWLSRVGIAAAALVVVVTAIVGVVAYQTARRAWLVQN